MRTEQRKGVWRAYTPFFIVILVGLFYHLRMQPMSGDDPFFADATKELGLWGYLAHRYVHWTSRVVSEFILVNVIQLPLLWRLLDFLMFASLPVILSDIFGGGRMMNWCASTAVLLFPFHDMGTAGWITTTVTHFWPLWGICYLGLLVRKLLLEERVRPICGILGVPVCIMTCSHEQYAVIFLVILLLGGVFRRLVSRGRVSVNTAGEATAAGRALYVSFLIIDLVSLLVIALCPGNAARNAVSIADLPVYAEFGFGEKLYLGLLSVERVFIANADAVFVAVTALWAMLVYQKTRSYLPTLLSALPLLVLFGQTVLRTAYPGLSGLFVMPEEILEWSWGELSAWLPMVYLAACLASMVYALCQLFWEEPFSLVCVLLLLGCGFGAAMILGFMATIYVSGERAYAPLYMSLLAVTLYALHRQRDALGRMAETDGGRLFLTPFAVLCLTNILFIGLSV